MIAALGTGIAGKAIGSKLVSGGEEVILGSRAACKSKASEWGTQSA